MGRCAASFYPQGENAALLWYNIAENCLVINILG